MDLYLCRKASYRYDYGIFLNEIENNILPMSGVNVGIRLPDQW